MSDVKQSQNPRVRAALAEYLERVDRGERVDPNAFLAEHAEIADELRSFLAMSAELGQLAGRRSKNEPGEKTPNVAEQNTQSVLEAAAQTQSPQKPPVAGSESLGGLPEKFGRYRVLKALGGGAMGMVYLAEDTQLDRQVALKIPNFDKDETGELLERFHREAKAAAKLRHANICPVYDSGALDGRHYIVMAFIPGKSLASFIRPDRPQTERQCLGVIRKLALGLQAAHDEGVVHRDLKPANVMVDEKAEPVITDFGLASMSQRSDQSRLTQSGMILGSPAYMSPEQIEGEPEKIKPASDQYALGVILYELLTSQVPFRGGITQIIHAIMHKAPTPPGELRPGLDPRVEALCLKMMSKSPADRFPSCKAVADEINRLLKELPAKGGAGESRVVAAATPAAGSPVRTMAEKASPRGDVPAKDTAAKNVRAAEQSMARHEYEQAVRMLEQIPEAQRTAQINVLLEKARQLAGEVAFLLEEIGRAGAANDRELALKKVDALARLAPSHPKVSEWKGMPGLPAFEESAPKRPRSKGQGGGFGKLPPAVKIGGAAAAALVLLLGVVLFVRTGKAVVRVEVNDPSIEVALNGETLKLNGTSQQVTVKAGEGTLTVRVGDLSFTSDSFTLKKGENDAVVVTLLDEKLSATFGERSLGEWDASGRSSGAGAASGPLQRTDDPREIDFAVISAGEFDMGSDDPSHQADEKPKHRVRLSRGFEMSRTEITVAQFRKFAESDRYRTEAETGTSSAWVADPANGQSADRKRPGTTWLQPGFTQGGDHPVVCVSQKDAVAFCQWLSNQTGRKYRLPTEAEWEYACRAGTTGDYWFGNESRVSKCANIADESLRKTFAVSYPKMEMTPGDDGQAHTAPVGSYEPNAFGLYDMAGNVWELCSDMYDGRGYGSPGLVVDPFSTGYGDTKTSPVLRGGSYFVPLWACRSSNRSFANYDNVSNSCGFRVVRELDASAVAATARTSPPPADAEVFQGHAYKYFPERMTWTDAKKRCEELGGRLPIIRNKEQNDFITRIARRNFKTVAGKEAIWIGLTDAAKHGEWRWIDGTLAQYTNWGPRQPNNKKPKQDYVLLKLPDRSTLADGIWADEPDNPEVHVPHVICEWDVAAPAGAIGAARIPPDAEVHQGHAYKFFAEQLSWTDAKRRCEQMGGRLPKVVNAGQNGFIARLARRGFTRATGMEAVWLGASDAFKEGEWRWTDGTPATYTNWGPKQPNNKGAGEDFAVLWLPAKNDVPDGVWSDQPEVSIEHVVHFVCEWEVAGAPAAARPPSAPPSAILLSSDYEWTAPESLGPGVNTSSLEGSPTLTSDEKLLLFVRAGDVYQSRRNSIDEPFPTATRLPPPISRANSRQGFVSISGDGLLLAVTSDRGKGTDGDVYLSERKSIDGDFSAPTLLPSPVNSGQGDRVSWMSPDGLSLIVSSERKGGHGSSDLHLFMRASRSERFGNEQNLGPVVNTPKFDSSGSMSSDGLVLLRTTFSGPPVMLKDSKEIASSTICYRTSREGPFNASMPFGGPFQQHHPVGAVLSSDCRRMYFSSRFFDGKGQTDLFVSRRAPKTGLSRINEAWQTAASGLKYRIIRGGDGARPGSTDRVSVHYRGWLDDGREFDSSYKRGAATEIDLSQSIAAWKEALSMICVGGIIEFDAPPSLAYGGKQTGPIPPNSTLHFVAELVEIVSDAQAIAPLPRLEALSELNSAARDGFAWVSADGLRIYWEHAEVGSSASTIWQAERPRLDAPFSNKRAVGVGRQPTLTPDELELLFLQPDAKDRKRIFSASRRTRSEDFGPGAEVAALSSYSTFNNPSLSADGLSLTVNSKQPDDAAVYLVSRRKSRNAPWEKPEQLDIRWDAKLQGAPLTWISMAADELSFLATHELDVGKFRVVRFTRKSLSDPFVSFEYLTIPGVGATGTVFGRAPRIAAATRELYVTATPSYFESFSLAAWQANGSDLWVIRDIPEPLYSGDGAIRAASRDDDGWIDLFNGRDLTGWKQFDGDGGWSVKDGILQTSAAANRLIYTAREFGDVHLRAECRLAGGANSGLVMRCLETSQPENGVEAQLAQVGAPFTGANSQYATGSIWQVAPYSKKVVEDNNWFRIDFICRDGTLTVQIDGVTTTTAPVPAALHDRGFVGLSQFNEGRTAQFRSVRARPLSVEPSRKPMEVPAATAAASSAPPAEAAPSPRAADKPPVAAPGKWESLFNGKDLTGWKQMAVSSGWTLRGGAIAAVPGEPGGWIASERTFSDFELEFEYRIPPNGNSGVFLRIPETGNVTGAEFLEIQLLDDFGPKTKNSKPEHKTGSIHGVVAASPPAGAAANRWHEMTIRAVGTKITVTLNNRKILDTDLDLYPKSTAAKPNFKRTSGHIGLQRHGSEVEFRKIRVREIAKP